MSNTYTKLYAKDISEMDPEEWQLFREMNHWKINFAKKRLKDYEDWNRLLKTATDWRCKPHYKCLTRPDGDFVCYRIPGYITR